MGDILKCYICKKEITEAEAIRPPALALKRSKYVCSPATERDCAVVLSQELLKKKAEANAKKERKILKERKAAVKKLSAYLAEAQASINAFVRVRDFLHPCISCERGKEQVEREQGWKHGGAWDCGHFMSRGAKSQLRFNLWNMHKQCKSCNGGEHHYSRKRETVSKQYEAALIAKIGQERVEWLKNNNEIRRFDREYCERIKRIFNKRTRLYKKLRGIE